MRPCSCGSGLTRRELKDGYGIFMCFVCDKCEKTRRSDFRLDIGTRYDTDEQIESDY